jgi:two-component system LytT family response regulator
MIRRNVLTAENSELALGPAATVTALVVDDETIARDGLGGILTSLGGIEVLGGCRNGRDAIRAIRTHSPDVVFLDVEMPDLNGLDIIRSIRAELPADELPIFVFVTAYSNYAIEAFNLAVSDYLIKPFSDARVALCLRRVRRLLACARAERLNQAVIALAAGGLPMPVRSSGSAEPYIRRVLIPHGVRTVVVPVDTIDWLGADNEYVAVHSRGKTYLMRGPLSTIVQNLDPRVFVRVHRSIVANMEQIVELQRDRNGLATLLLRDGTRLSIGRRRYEEIHQQLGSRTARRAG